jgi:hypothetical protein
MKLDINHGDKFNMLTVIEELPCLRLPSGQTNRFFWCLCDCGKETNVRIVHLKNLRTVSCGCYKRYSKGDEYKAYIRKAWRAIKYRTSSNYFQSDLYYDKGVKVCEEWLNNFDSFYLWSIQNGYKKGLHIDRIDSNGDYSPENCRVVTPKINANNKKDTHYVTYNGETVALKIILDTLGKSDMYYTIRGRIKRGWNEQKAIDTPIRKGNYKRTL